MSNEGIANSRLEPTEESPEDSFVKNGAKARHPVGERIPR